MLKSFLLQFFSKLSARQKKVFKLFFLIFPSPIQFISVSNAYDKNIIVFSFSLSFPPTLTKPVMEITSFSIFFFLISPFPVQSRWHNYYLFSSIAERFARPSATNSTWDDSRLISLSPPSD